jgi:excisionase family DNA binding protein
VDQNIGLLTWGSFSTEWLADRTHGINRIRTEIFTNAASFCCYARSCIAGILGMKRAYSINEFCNIYQLGRTKVYEEIKFGRLIAVKVGSRTIIRADDAETWLASLKEASHAA